MNKKKIKTGIIKKEIYKGYFYRTESSILFGKKKPFVSIVGYPPNHKGTFVTLWMSSFFDNEETAEIAAKAFIDGILIEKCSTVHEFYINNLKELK